MATPHRSHPAAPRLPLCLALLLLLGPLVAAQGGATQPETEHPTVNVFGLVSTPGEYAWTTGLTVGDAVALAGGYTEDGSKDELQIQRVVDGKLVSMVSTEADPVQAEDVVMVRGQRFRPSNAR